MDPITGMFLLLVAGGLCAAKAAKDGARESGLGVKRPRRNHYESEEEDESTGDSQAVRVSRIASEAARRSRPSPVQQTRHPAGMRVVNFGTFPVAKWLHDHGWTHDDGIYRGHFVSQGRRIRGEVHYRAGEFELLFHKPPRWATQGDHSACWRERPGDWRLLHLNASPGNVVEAIIGCQAFLERKLQEHVA